MDYRCIGLDIWRVFTSPIPRSWEVTQLCRCFFGQGDEFFPSPCHPPKTGSFCKILPYTGVGSLYSIDFWFSGVLYLGQQIGICKGEFTMKKIGLGIAILLFAIIISLCSSGMGLLVIGIGIVGLIFSILGFMERK